jgi:hypothetical protein
MHVSYFLQKPQRFTSGNSPDLFFTQREIITIKNKQEFGDSLRNVESLKSKTEDIFTFRLGGKSLNCILKVKQKLKVMRTFALLVFLLGTTLLAAQKIEHFSVAVMNESIAFPFTRYTPIHPGLEVGATFWSKEKEHSQRYLSAYAGGFYHEKVETGFYLRAEYLFAFKIAGGLYADVPLGIGYLHTIYPSELYKQNPETGNFEEVSQFGRPHGLVTAGVGLRYAGESRIQPFIRQELAIETPFANGFPVIPHAFLKLGVNLKIQ